MFEFTQDVVFLEAFDAFLQLYKNEKRSNKSLKLYAIANHNIYHTPSWNGKGYGLHGISKEYAFNVFLSKQCIEGEDEAFSGKVYFPLSECLDEEIEVIDRIPEGKERQQTLLDLINKDLYVEYRAVKPFEAIHSKYHQHQVLDSNKRTRLANALSFVAAEKEEFHEYIDEKIKSDPIDYSLNYRQYKKFESELQEAKGHLKLYSVPKDARVYEECFKEIGYFNPENNTYYVEINYEKRGTKENQPFPDHIQFTSGDEKAFADYLFRKIEKGIIGSIEDLHPSRRVIDIFKKYRLKKLFEDKPTNV